MSDKIKTNLRLPIKYFCILIVRYFQRRYKIITIKNRYNQTNQVINKLILIQSILYYFHNQYSAWGYFHPSCVWSENDDKFFNWLFPPKDDFDELNIVVYHNPEAVTYYRNKVYNRVGDVNYKKEIKKQLTHWNKWY